MMAALRGERARWTSRDGRLGFTRTTSTGSDADTDLTAFLLDVQKAARDVTGLPGTTPGQMAAAIRELESNIRAFERG